MTHPKDQTPTIPEDITKAADEAAKQVYSQTIGSDDGSHFMDTAEASEIIAKAILAERERDRWMPIDSAPRDGTQFLAFEMGSHFNCWWHNNGFGEEYWMDEADSEPTPSHWQPLPAAPKAGV